MLKKLLLAVVGLVASIGMAIAAVNINTATEKELDSLPGVGAAKAKAIVEYRKSNGNFKSVDDLKNVKGIGDKNFAKLKDQITVSGATTVPPTKTEKAEKVVKEKAKDAKEEVKADAKAAAGATKSAAAVVVEKTEKAGKKAKDAVTPDSKTTK